MSRTLKRAGWSRKVAQQVAKDRHPDLQDLYLYDVSAFDPDHVVYVDETGGDNRLGYRRMVWSPLGTTPVQVARFHRGQRYHVLPAYTSKGILHFRVYQGSTDGSLFEEFIEQLLTFCRPWPQRHSVLIMDNASFHKGPKVQQLYDAAGVKLLYLPPYSPHLNPIEETFGRFKACVKTHWSKFLEDPERRFSQYLVWCLEMVGMNEKSARGHLRHAGWAI